MPSQSQGLYRVAILVSGNGSNMEALIQACEQGLLPKVKIALVISNRIDAGAIAKAQNHGIPTAIVPSKHVADDAFQAAVLDRLLEIRIDIVCLAGYLKKVGPEIVRRFSGRILNIHPALLPKYGGGGMYGHFVHEAVIKDGAAESGCSVHLVDDEFDHGRVLAQVRVPVVEGDSAETLAKRVLQEEHKLYPMVLRQFCERLASSGEKHD